MTTRTILVLLVATASTIAFSPQGAFRQSFADHPSLSARRRRDISTGSKTGSGSGAGAGSFAFSGSSSSSSGSAPGYTTSISSRTGISPEEAQGQNSVNPGNFNAMNPSGYGNNDFNFPNPSYANPYPNQYGGGYVPDYNQFFQQYMAFMQRLAQQQAAYAHNDISTRGGFGPDNFGAPQNGFYFPGPNHFGGNGGNFGGNPDASASASASLNPRGGFGSASISPAPQGDPGLATRMGSVPASGGGNFAVFSSSSSGSTDNNGVKKSFKEATAVVNDNGKVTTYHVSDP